MQWAISSNADLFVRHAGTNQTAVTMLGHGHKRKATRERCERAMASFPPVPFPDMALGCGNVNAFLFLDRCKRHRNKIEEWLSRLKSGEKVEDIAAAIRASNTFDEAGGDEPEHVGPSEEEIAARNLANCM